jgi:hypothetical protein
MSFKQIMQPYERKQFIAEGDFLYVESAPGELVIYAERGQYTLRQGAQILSATLKGQLTIENRSNGGLVSLVVGFGEYKPPQQESFAISSLPDVTLAAGQSVVVSELPAVGFKAGQQVAVSNLTSSLFNSAEFSAPHAFAANANRTKLMIKANASNYNSLLVGAYELNAGESIELPTTAAVTISGDTSAKFQFIEV